MKKIVYLLTLSLFISLSACKKEDNTLNITYKKTTTNNSKGVKITPQQSNVNIYPNPFVNQVTIQFDLPYYQDATILLKSADGRFKTIELQENTLELDFSEEPKGIYYCEIKIGGVIYQKQLSKLAE